MATNLTQNNRALSGNHLMVKLNGTPVGFVQSITGQDDYGLEPLSGVGNIHVFEWVPSLAHYTITVDRMVLKISSLQTVAAGAPDNAGGGGQGSGSTTQNNGKGIWEDGYQMMQGFIFDIELVGGAYQMPHEALNDATVSQSSGTTFKHWYGCSFAQGNVRITKNAIVVEDATFYCLEVSGSHTIGAAS